MFFTICFQLHDVFFILFLSYPVIFPAFPICFSPFHCMLYKHTRAHTSSLDEDSPKQTAVVLLNGKCPETGTLTTMCIDPPSKAANKQQNWLSLLRPSTVNIHPNSTLRFSMSLNDVGQRVDSLCRGLNFIDRTCSEGELGAKAEPVQPAISDQRALTLNGKLPSEQQTSNPAFLVPSLTNNHKYILAVPTVHLPVAPPPASNFHPNHSPSSSFLRRFLPFSRSSTSTSLQCSDLGSYTSHLHIAKSSSTLLESNEPSLINDDVLGDDDVFEEDQTLLKDRREVPVKTAQVGLCSLHAPMCYMDEDTDLDGCPTPLSEKAEPLSPFSLSGDCCRWVTVEVDSWCSLRPPLL